MIKYQFVHEKTPFEYPFLSSGGGGGSIILYDEEVELGPIETLRAIDPGINASIAGVDGFLSVSSVDPVGIFPIAHTDIAIILDDTHYTIIFDTAMNNTLQCQLPDATLHTGRIYEVKNGGVGHVSINANFSQFIDQFMLFLTLMSQNEAVRIQSDGIGWIILG